MCLQGDGESQEGYSFTRPLEYLPPPAEMGWGAEKVVVATVTRRPGQARRRSPTPLPPGAQPLNAEREAVARGCCPGVGWGTRPYARSGWGGATELG